ncbi:MAG: alkaline phosphatase family protein [Saprospiraceae bacterium]|nr:alkaline phosphatase family protein [Saprospiraceae bacterium]
MSISVRFILSLFCCLTIISGFSQKTVQKKDVLHAGPLIGYLEKKEALIWLQTKNEVELFIEYFNIVNQGKKFRTKKHITKKETGYTARILLDEVQPGTTYHYDVYVNRKKVLFTFPTEITTQTDWRFKMDPSPFKAAFGSCTYINETITDRPGSPYGGDYQIFESIHKKNPDLMLWGGDNIYLRPADWSTRTGYVHRYTHARALPELEKLMAGRPNLAIWDDHDFGPNDANGSFFMKPFAHETFHLFWPNPPCVSFSAGPSLCTAMEFNGIDFFTLDNRSFRTEIWKDTSLRQIFGKEQIEWLINNLKSSQSPFKMVMVGGQMVSDAAVKENFANYPEEKKYFFDRLEEENIQGVIFLTGDRHFSELSVIKNRKGNTILEITSSPLTSGVVTPDKENNSHRVEESLIEKRSFVLLSFDGKLKARTLAATWFDSDGNELYKYNVTEAEMSPKKKN